MEKVLAARAAGITRVFLPDRNEADVAEIRGDDLLKGLQFCYVEHVSAVLDQIFIAPKKRRAGAACDAGRT
jgi:ATP-dependent Lon protease